MRNNDDFSTRLWVLIAFVSFLSFATWSVTGVGVTGEQVAGLLVVVVILLGVSIVYTRLRPDRQIARLSRGMAELFLLVFMIGTLSYNAASLDRPLWDETFQAWDTAIGFDWRFWLSVVDAHPGIHEVLVLAYHSMLPQTVLAIVALVAARAYRHLDVYLLAYGIAALATVAISALMPALSPVVHLGIVPADHPNIALAVSPEFQEQALALREGRMKLVDLGSAQGLVTFPSFHTVSAVILLLAFSAVPYLRWVSVCVNLAMLVSIPIEGSHYIVDVIAGAALAFGAWISAAWIIRTERTRSATSGAAVLPPHPSFSPAVSRKI